MELVVATNNKGKLYEIQSLLPDAILRTLEDIGYGQEIPEPYSTFRENAWIKAQTVHDYCGLPVMADDSGLCVDALGGAPGVWSARYAGADAGDGQNLQKVLNSLEGEPDRTAHYIAVICLITTGDTRYFEGKCAGRIARAPQGTGGFGYDPVFVPDGYEQTFGELPPGVKNGLSHRGVAIRKMVQYLNEKV